MSTTNRWFVLCSTLNITLAVNLLFFQLGDIKEVCEATFATNGLVSTSPLLSTVVQSL